MTAHDLTQSRLRRQRGAEAPTIARFAEAPLASARLAGVLYLIIITFGIFAELVVRSRLIADGNAEQTAANILDSEWLFRMGLAADLVVFLSDVALAIVLYVLFRPVSTMVSLLAAAFRLTQTAIIGLNLLSMFAALLILKEADYLGAFSKTESEQLALLYLDLHAYGYTLGLTFFGVSTLAIAYLALQSRVVPKALAVLLGLAGLGYLADSAAFFLVPGYDGAVSPIFLAPALVGEVWFAFWLLFKGRRLQALADASPPGAV